MPRILLALGALCLLVAAVIFLAVAWSALGVGGRTAVLVALTLTAGAASLGLHRSGLRVAGESLSVVALGLLALDVVGGVDAGWFGAAAEDRLALVLGAVVGGAAIGMAAVPFPGRPRLVAPQLVTGVAAVLVYAGGVASSPRTLLVGHLTVLGVAAVAYAGRRARLLPLAWSVAAAGAIAWLGTASVAFVGVVLHLTFAGVWGGAAGWSLLASAACLVLPGVVAGHRPTVLVGASAAALLATATAVLPAVDETAGTIALVTVAVTAGWTLALAVVPASLRVVPVAPAVGGALLLVGQLLVAGGTALARWSELPGLLDLPAGVRLDRPEPTVEPLVVVPAVVVLAALAALLSPGTGRERLRAWLPDALLATTLGVILTIGQYDVPLAVVVAALAATGTVTAVAAHLRGAATGAVAALVLAAGAAVVALPSGVLTLGAATVTAVLAVGTTVLARSAVARFAGGVLVAPSLALAAAAAVQVAGRDDAWTAVAVLLVAGPAAVARPRPEVEVPAVAVALIALPASVSAADTPDDLVSLWLVLAGALVAATALLHPERRRLAVGAPVLWLLASWVRLSAAGVTTVEAYTLPTAALLLVVGLLGLRADPDRGTWVALSPGLSLATLPTLVVALGDPVSLRALLLGAGCVALVLAGALLRWSGPLVVGAGVGAVLVLRELGPYAAAVPQWIWIGLAGTLLTLAGVTWERRLAEARHAFGTLARLR
ncbi:hypothetical protein [Nocardioides sp. YIM 152588]|uniref:SCO7613 C-terminal domain-containing membrane protein n=1 Tax=Nocardioides sp. YIM 152588 TaxID=3158259 RepID=UPI0032E36900